MRALAWLAYLGPYGVGVLAQGRGADLAPPAALSELLVLGQVGDAVEAGVADAGLVGAARVAPGDTWPQAERRRVLRVVFAWIGRLHDLLSGWPLVDRSAASLAGVTGGGG